jgi:hypothetical protein
MKFTVGALARLMGGGRRWGCREALNNAVVKRHQMHLNKSVLNEISHQIIMNVMNKEQKCVLRGAGTLRLRFASK